ncbi:T9SS type A sorting domain-containing protein [bacterium]|nr:T9SS type A sorting domain-containing protein [bacterium]MBU1638703.1 T9SS type A sorting domain-containing protein [bacterium]
MRHLFVFFFVCQSVIAANWEGAEWEILADTGSEINVLSGLHCTGDTLHLISSSDLNDHYFRWTPSGYLEEIAMPEALDGEWSAINYASVERTTIAFMSETDLWRHEGGHWIADELPVTMSRGYNGFCYDSSGALHLMQGTFGNGVSYYRRGGDRPDRDEYFTNVAFLGHSNYAPLFCPTANNVAWLGGEWNTDENNTLFNIGLRISEGEDAFQIGLISNLGPIGQPRAHLSAWGEWIAGYAHWINGVVLGIGQGTGTPAFFGPFQAYIFHFEFCDDPALQEFGVAGLDNSGGNYQLRVAGPHIQFGYWHEQLSIASPATNTALHYMIDSEGFGHVFVAQDSIIWHYGRPADEATCVDRPEIANVISLQVFPNPFNAQTAVQFDLPMSSPVKLTVHDLLGRLSTTLLDGSMPSGNHRILFDADNLSSGSYWIHLATPDHTATQQLLLIK